MRNALGFFCVVLVSFITAAAEPAAINARSLQPGLHATYRSLVDNATLYRNDVKPALALGTYSPHPRIAPGPFSVVWTGVIQLRGEGPFVFDAFVGGEVTLKIDNAVVLQGRGEAESAQIRSKETFKRAGTRFRISVEYRSLPGVPARLQLWWEGADFAREPLPGWLLKHEPEEAPEIAPQENIAAAGRAAVGRFGCARCHADAYPGITDPLPGPSLAGIGARVGREWLFNFLNDPSAAHTAARMPALFKADRAGVIERWIIAEYLLKESAQAPKPDAPPGGDHRQGKKHFLSIGCVACHFVPDMKRDGQKDMDRTGLERIADRLPPAPLGEFLQNPVLRYPDGHHPAQPLSPEFARDIAAYLLLWSKHSATAMHPEPAVTADEIEQTARRLDVTGLDSAAKALLRSKGCVSCHAGLGKTQALKVPLAADKTGGCLSGTGTPRFKLDAPTREALIAYTAVAARERHASPPEERRQMIARMSCFRCHSATDRTPPLEEASSSLGGSLLESIPYLRTPRLSNAVLKYTHEHLITAIRDGVSGIRHKDYSFRMPRFGPRAESIVQALAEMDGDLLVEPPAQRPASDPTLKAPGGTLVGFEGYSCISCHVWNGKRFNEGDPGAIGPDLTTITHRIRRDWFDRWMDEPARIHPGTAMPQIFTHGQPAQIKTVFDGDTARQKEAIWTYLSLGKDAPSPKPLPPVPVDLPAANAPPLVAQIPIKTLDGKNVESICIAYGTHDLLLYDVGETRLQGAYSAAQILRAVRGRVRTFALAGTPLPEFSPATAGRGLEPKPQALELLGYDRLPDGARLRLRARYAERSIDGTETLRVAGRKLNHEIQWQGAPATTETFELGATVVPAAMKYPVLPDPGPVDGSLERPGYRAIAFPRPKTITGEDLIMPGAIAAHPVDGRVFVASMKSGELFVLRDPTDDGKNARYDNYAGGLFQEAYSMLAEKDGLYVLHRRNLIRIRETDGNATHFDRVLALPHGIAETYDYGYGLVRDKNAFVFSFAPYANRKLPGSGSVIRMVPGEKPEELAFGFRNPVGWCSGPDGEIFYTDNQGEWIATNKLCHIVKGRYYGFPNPEQREHTAKPFGKTTLWVPYAWARSINGVTYNNSGDKFGPFNGQFFLAELMYGGAIIRASLEKVNGEYQGACFPFWGKGLLGPVTLAFDPKGRLFVGSITEPGWMAQPDRGAVFRIDFTGQTPFEIQSINVRPRGFRLNFTRAIDAQIATSATAYAIEHYRYEYTGAYGSPELDRTTLPIEKIDVAPDGRSVELTTGALVKERVYMIGASGVKSTQGEALVQPVGAYTLNEIPEPAK